MDSPLQRQYKVSDLSSKSTTAVGSTSNKTTKPNVAPTSPTQGTVNLGQRGQRDERDQRGEIIEEIELLERQIVEASVPKPLEERLLRNVQRLQRMARFGSYSGEFELIKKYADWVTEIPWNNATKDHLDLARAREMLEKNH